MPQRTIHFRTRDGLMHSVTADVAPDATNDDLQGLVDDATDQIEQRNNNAGVTVPSGNSPGARQVRLLFDNTDDKPTVLAQTPNFVTPGSYADQKLRQSGPGWNLTPQDVMNFILGGAGEAASAPALTASGRLKNALLGAVKGLGLYEAGKRANAVVEGQKQPPLINLNNPVDMAMEAGAGLMGGIGGFGPGQVSDPEQDARLLWQAKNAQMDNQLDRMGAQKVKLQNAHDAAKNAFEAHQKTLSVATKQMLQNAAENDADDILRAQDELAQLKLRAQQGFEPDQDTVKDLQDTITGLKTKAQNLRGAAAQTVLRKAGEHQKQLDQMLNDADAAEAGHMQQILDKQSEIRRLKVMQRRANQGRVDVLPTNKDVADGQKYVQLKKSMEDTNAALQQHENDMADLKIARADHMDNAPPPNEDVDNFWAKLQKAAMKGGPVGGAAYLFMQHMGVPAPIAREVSAALAVGANTPAADAAKRFLRGPVAGQSSRVAPFAGEIANQPQQ